MGLAHFDSETIEPNWAKRSQVGPGSSWVRPILTRSQIGPRSQDGSEHYKVDDKHKWGKNKVDACNEKPIIPMYSIQGIADFEIGAIKM